MTMRRALIVLTTLLLAAPPAAAEDTVGLIDPTGGLWYLRDGSGAVTSFFYGNPGDFPMVGDWDCDGVDTPGLYRQSDGFVYLRNSNTQGIADIRFFFGNPGDIPLAGDFNNDGCDTVSIYRVPEARIYVINELGANDGGLGAADFNYVFGNPGDKPFVGDFDGNGEDTVGLHRESTGFVYFRNSHTQGNANAEFFFGDPGDRLVAGDWGVVDGTDTPAVFRPSNTTFFFRYTNTQGNADEAVAMGQPSYLPVAGRWSQSDNPVPPGPPVPPPPPTIGGPLPAGLVNAAYSGTLTKSGGQAPVTVTKISGNATWANVSAAGVVSGTPPTTGNFTLGVRITDALGRVANATVPIQVVNGCEGTGTLPLAQCQALVDLYRSTNGRTWTESTGWLAGNPCTVPWQGVTCIGNNVTEIELDENNLTGTISSLSAFTALTVLDLTNNAIGGSVPDVSALTSLNTVDLGGNGLTGTHASLWTSASLANLDLSDNTFTGAIPGTINLLALQTLNLSNSGLGGAIPAGLWSSVALTDIDLSENTFSGPIPPAIGNLVSLLELDLSDNTMSGAIPPEFIQLSPANVPPGSLTGLSLTSNGCFTIDPADTTLLAFVSGLDPEWNDGCV